MVPSVKQIEGSVVSWKPEQMALRTAPLSNFPDFRLNICIRMVCTSRYASKNVLPHFTNLYIVFRLSQELAIWWHLHGNPCLSETRIIEHVTDATYTNKIPNPGSLFGQSYTCILHESNLWILLSFQNQIVLICGGVSNTI